MTDEISTIEQVVAMKIYGSCSDEVCYASRRLQKIGAVPFTGRYDGKVQDVYSMAIAQAKKNNEMVSVYLDSGEVKGLFLVTPGHPSPEFIDSYWPVFKEKANNSRWDKPIEEQKKEEPLDRFSIYEYAKKLCEKWGVIPKEGQYAAERLERMGVKPYTGRITGDAFDLFWNAMKQAKKDNNKVGVYLNSGIITGLFVVAPEARANDQEYATSKFEQYVKDQQRIRYDKPIAMQEVEDQRVAQLKTLNNGRK